MTTTDTPRTDALPTWKCTSCGCIEHKEEEVICWNCGKGEMIYQRSTTDTPRTDAYNNSLGVVPAAFARELERELNESQAEVERLRKDRYPFQSFDQFCNFLTSTNLIDEPAVSDPEGWDGGAELSRIEKAFDRYLDQTNQ